MKKTFKIILIIILPIILVVAIVYPSFHKWARAHVNSKTAVEDHPLNCASCHLYIRKTGIIHKMVNTQYYSPFNLAVSEKGDRVYVVAEEGNALLVVDTKKDKVIEKIKVGERPHSVILSKDESRAYVSNQWAANVSVIDLKTMKVTDTLQVADGPAELALSADGRFLYVVDSYSSNLSVIDLETKEEVRRLAMGNNPTGIQATPDGSKLLVTSRRTMGRPYDDTIKCEMTVVDDKTKSIIERKSINDAYMIENIAFTPSGDLAVFPLIRPKNNITTVQVDRGWMMTHGFGIIEMKPGGRTIELLLDEPNQYFADPYDIAISNDGKRAFITSSGVDYVSVVNLDSVRAILKEKNPEVLKLYANDMGISSKYIVKRIKTGANPKGLVLSADGVNLYVAEHLQDRIAVIDARTLETKKTIELGGPRRTTVARQGRRLLNNAGATFQTQFSCYTCHPDAHEDGLVYNMASKDMGRNVTNTQSLRDISKTAPYKWNGKNATVYKQDGMRFSTVLTRNEPFSYDNLDALVSYIMTGIDYPPNLVYNPDGYLTKNQLLGKAIFERTHDNNGKLIPEEKRCSFCHPAPYYTNRKSFDVGTLAATDDSILFDTPHLNNIYASAPYLHDGRAKTLEEIWTIYGKTEQHGIVNDLTKMDLNNLIEYLKSLRAPEYEKADQAKRAKEKKKVVTNHYE
jgi:YVTN family beta-propeller protein